MFTSIARRQSVCYYRYLLRICLYSPRGDDTDKPRVCASQQPNALRIVQHQVLKLADNEAVCVMQGDSGRTLEC